MSQFGYWTKFDLAVHQYESQVAYLKAVCRIAADKLKDGGTFPVNGELWDLLDFAAGETKRTDAASSREEKK